MGALGSCAGLLGALGLLRCAHFLPAPHLLVPTLDKPAPLSAGAPAARAFAVDQRVRARVLYVEPTTKVQGELNPNMLKNPP